MEERVSGLLHSLFQITYTRVCRSLLKEHHLALALRLCQIRLKFMPLEGCVAEKDFEFLLRTTTGTVPYKICRNSQNRRLLHALEIILLFECSAIDDQSARLYN